MVLLLVDRTFIKICLVVLFLPFIVGCIIRQIRPGVVKIEGLKWDKENVQVLEEGGPGKELLFVIPEHKHKKEVVKKDPESIVKELSDMLDKQDFTKVDYPIVDVVETSDKIVVKDTKKKFNLLSLTYIFLIIIFIFIVNVLMIKSRKKKEK
jgi:hypothetical protein